MNNIGGVERIVQDVFLLDESPEVENLLISTSYINELIQPIRDKGLKVYTPTRIFRYDPFVILRMKKWIKENGIDIIHSYNSFANVTGLILSSLTGIPQVCSEHGTVWNTRGFRFYLDKLAYRRAAAVTSNSSASQRMLELRYGLSKDRIQIVYNPIPKKAVSASKFKIKRTLDFDTNKVLVGTIGRLVPLKGMDIFIEAAHILLKNRQDVQFVIVGGGKEMERLKNLNRTLIKKGGREDSGVGFLGWREDARVILKAFDLFAICSYREPFGNVLIEAGQEGIAVIAPAIDGIVDAVVDGKTGMLVVPTENPVNIQGLPGHVLIDGELKTPKGLNPLILAERINYLINNEELRMKMGQEGRRYADRFSMEKYLSNTHSIYLKLEV